MTLEFSDFIDKLWDNGAGRYFTNLRRLRLFANKISYSLQITSGEVSFQDFLTLEVIRNIHPPLYDAIYHNGPNYFYDPSMAFETWGQRSHALDEERAKKAR